MTFLKFIERRMDPFGAMAAPFGMQVADMFHGQRDLLIELAGIKSTDVEQSELAWIQTRPGAAKAEAVIRECATLETSPTLATIRAVWARLNPQPPDLHRTCDACGGTGWVVKEIGSGASYRSGAAPCPQRIGPGVAKAWRRIAGFVLGRRA